MEVAGTDGTINMADFGSTLNDQNSTNFKVPCSQWDAYGDYIVMRMHMGTMVQFFRPQTGNTLCSMLNTYNLHLYAPYWGAAWVQPVYDTNHNGGSMTGWPPTAFPEDLRYQLSNWGDYNDGATLGGCCALSRRVPSTGGPESAWGRPFLLSVTNASFGWDIQGLQHFLSASENGRDLISATEPLEAVSLQSIGVSHLLAFSFNNTAGQRVVYGDHVGHFGEDATLIFAFRPHSWPAAVMGEEAWIISKWNNEAAGVGWACIRLQTSTKFMCGPGPTITGAAELNVEQSSFPLNTWTQVALVKKGSNFSLYLNGSLSVTKDWGGTNYSTRDAGVCANLTIGVRPPVQRMPYDETNKHSSDLDIGCVQFWSTAFGVGRLQTHWNDRQDTCASAVVPATLTNIARSVKHSWTGDYTCRDEITGAVCNGSSHSYCPGLEGGAFCYSGSTQTSLGQQGRQGTAPFTILFYVWQDIVSFWPSTEMALLDKAYGPTGVGYSITQSSNHPGRGNLSLFYDDSPGSVKALQCNGTIWPEVWYQVAFVRSSNTTSLYREGVLCDTAAVAANESFNGDTGDLQLGGRDDQMFFQGRLDCVQIFSRALNATEIEFHMTHTAALSAARPSG